MRAMITGAAGFLGRALTARLREEGWDVVGVDRHADPAAGIQAGDISEPGPWQGAAAGCDVVLHTAALVGMPTDVSAFWRVNVRGTRLVLDAAREHGVARVLHVSSVVTFGLDFPDGVDESYPVRPTGVAYTDTKIAAEQVVLMAHAAGEQDVTVIRPGDIYGPGSQPWVLLPLKELRARRLILPAMGRGIHSPVYVDDVARGIARAATEPRAAGRVITLSGGAGVTTRDYFGRLGRIAGLRVPVVPTLAARAGVTALVAGARMTRSPLDVSVDAVRYLADRRGTYGIGTARELLGWTPQIGLDDGFSRTEAWLRAERLV